MQMDDRRDPLPRGRDGHDEFGREERRQGRSRSPRRAEDRDYSSRLPRRDDGYSRRDDDAPRRRDETGGSGSGPDPSWRDRLTTGRRDADNRARWENDHRDPASNSGARFNSASGALDASSAAVAPGFDPSMRSGPLPPQEQSFGGAGGTTGMMGGGRYGGGGGGGDRGPRGPQGGTGGGGGFSGGGGGGGGFSGGGAAGAAGSNGPGSWLEARVTQRKAMPMPWVWTRSPSPDRGGGKGARAKRPTDDSDASDSEEDRARGRKGGAAASSKRRRASSSSSSSSYSSSSGSSGSGSSSSSSFSASSGSSRGRHRGSRNQGKGGRRSPSPPRRSSSKRKGQSSRSKGRKAPKRSRRDKKGDKRARRSVSSASSASAPGPSASRDAAEEEKAAAGGGVRDPNLPAALVEPQQPSAGAPERGAGAAPAAAGRADAAGESSDDDDLVGPRLPVGAVAEDAAVAAGAASVNYGGFMRPGEGEAIAAYVQQNLRVPRRGEVGWTGETIDQLENAGYVMSGSRHKKMNAVRLRKENQVYSAEEKRALALFNYEEKAARETKLMAEFREMLSKNSAAGGEDAAK